MAWNVFNSWMSKSVRALTVHMSKESWLKCAKTFLWKQVFFRWYLLKKKKKKKKNRAFPTCLEKTKFAEIIGCSEQQEQPKLTFIWLKVYVKKECNLR